MADQRLILHIGASKCGSSALQRALCQRPNFGDESGGTVAYATLKPGGRLRSGSRLKSDALGTVAGYIQSGPALHIETLTDDQIRAARAAMRQTGSDRIILSCEGWLHVHQIFSRSQFIPRIGASAHVVVYVRPQVSFLNSGWWQWGAWGQKPLDHWLKRRLRSTFWTEFIKPWAKVPGIEKVTVRLLPADIVADFLTVIGCRSTGMKGGSATLNKGLPGPVLRLYQRHRKLRSPSTGPGMDFAIARYLGHFEPTPWVIAPSKAEEIIAATRDDNLALKDMLDPDSAAAMEADSHWWTADAYADKVVESTEMAPPDPSEMDRLCVTFAEALFRVAKENANLRRCLAEQNEDRL